MKNITEVFLENTLVNSVFFKITKKRNNASKSSPFSSSYPSTSSNLSPNLNFSQFIDERLYIQMSYKGEDKMFHYYGPALLLDYLDFHNSKPTTNELFELSKEQIKLMHNLSVVHKDTALSNFCYDEFNNRSYLMDFDHGKITSDEKLRKEDWKIFKKT